MAGAKALAAAGLGAVTVGRVAKLAGVSTALVHYHFSTKHALLVAAAGRLGAARADALARALGAGTGIAALDRVWDALARRARDGEERAYVELCLAAGERTELALALAAPQAALHQAIDRRLPGLLAELGAVPGLGADELATAVAVQLDGAALALATGRATTEVKAAWDAFWLMLIAAGEGGRRR